MFLMLQADSVGEQRGLLMHLSYIDAAHKISNVRFWHEADVLTDLKVRYERGADILTLR